MKSKYKYVRYDPDGRISQLRNTGTRAAMEKAMAMPWVARPMISFKRDDIRWSNSSTRRFDNEREAALYVDKWMIEHGREPVNILKRKESVA